MLEEAEDPANPLCERLNFASIFQSNLDEFYMVRVGMLMDTLHLTAVDDKTGLTSAQQTAAVLDRTRALLAQRDRVCRALMAELTGQGWSCAPSGGCPTSSRPFWRSILPPTSCPCSPPDHRPQAALPLPAQQGHLRRGHPAHQERRRAHGHRPLRRGGAPPAGPLPGDGQRFVLVEELIAGFLSKIFAHYKVEGAVLIRLVRSADIHMDDASSEMSAMLAEEYRKSMEKLIRRRKRLQPVKLEYQGKLSDTVRDALCACLGLSKKHLFSSDVPLDLSFLGAVRDLLREKTELFYPRRVPQNSPNVDPLLPMVQQIKKRDLMLTYPYESVRPMLRLLQEAGQDPEVVSIKMTLYRVAHNSKIVEALVDAAENGKEVVALVELRARFDEENNIGWSRVLEQSGCRVIYGLDGLKVHSKLLLITRVHNGQVEYITQVGTGNYNEDTVRLYTDYALMTASPEIGAEAAQVFNALSMGEVVEDSRHLMVAPACGPRCWPLSTGRPSWPGRERRPIWALSSTASPTS